MRACTCPHVRVPRHSVFLFGSGSAGHPTSTQPTYPHPHVAPRMRHARFTRFTRYTRDSRGTLSSATAATDSSQSLRSIGRAGRAASPRKSHRRHTEVNSSTSKQGTHTHTHTHLTSFFRLRFNGGRGARHPKQGSGCHLGLLAQAAIPELSAAIMARIQRISRQAYTVQIDRTQKCAGLGSRQAGEARAAGQAVGPKPVPGSITSAQALSAAHSYHYRTLRVRAYAPPLRHALVLAPGPLCMPCRAVLCMQVTALALQRWRGLSHPWQAPGKQQAGAAHGKAACVHDRPPMTGQP